MHMYEAAGDSPTFDVFQKMKDPPDEAAPCGNIMISTEVF